LGFDNQENLMSEMSKPPRKANATNNAAEDLTETPVKPVENFDPGGIDPERRIFQNGDTDRAPGKTQKPE
jgi:hypothetical protein